MSAYHWATAILTVSLTNLSKDEATEPQGRLPPVSSLFSVSTPGSQEPVLQPQPDSGERPGELRLPQHLWLRRRGHWRRQPRPQHPTEVSDFWHGRREDRVSECCSEVSVCWNLTSDAGVEVSHLSALSAGDDYCFAWFSCPTVVTLGITLSQQPAPRSQRTPERSPDGGHRGGQQRGRKPPASHHRKREFGCGDRHPPAVL